MNGHQHNHTSYPIVDIHVCGIPCKAQVTSLVHVEPWRGNIEDCPSSDDYYGYTEMEFKLLDRKGYPAPWLEKKMNSKSKEKEVEDTIFDALQEV